MYTLYVLLHMSYFTSLYVCELNKAGNWIGNCKAPNTANDLNY